MWDGRGGSHTGQVDPRGTVHHHHHLNTHTQPCVPHDLKDGCHVHDSIPQVMRGGRLCVYLGRVGGHGGGGEMGGGGDMGEGGRRLGGGEGCP